MAGGHVFGSWLSFLLFYGLFHSLMVNDLLNHTLDTQVSEWDKSWTSIISSRPDLSVCDFGLTRARYTRHRGNRYLNSRVCYAVNGSSSFQVSRPTTLPLCGDVASNPGPRKPATPKFPCKECGKEVRSDQDAILCSKCNCWSRARCLHMSKAGFLYYLENPSIEWACSLCSLTQLTVSDGECSVYWLHRQRLCFG